MSDADRQASKNGIDHIPVAYALKGPSLTVEIMRKMVEEVRNACKQHGVNILCECSDGQWKNIAFNSRDGEPLTKSNSKSKYGMTQ